MNSLSYVSVADLVNAYPTLASEDAGVLKKILMRAETYARSYIGCGGKVADPCVCPCLPCQPEFIPFSEFGCCDCPNDRGGWIPANGVPNDYSAFDVWKVIAPGSITEGGETVSFQPGQFLFAQCDSDGTPSLHHFFLMNTCPQEVCILPWEVREAVLLLALEYYKDHKASEAALASAQAGQGDCCGLDVSFFGMRIKKGNCSTATDPCKKKCYPHVDELLHPFVNRSCMGKIA